MQKALQTVGPGARGARDQVSGSSALVVPALGVAALRASLDWLRQRHHGSIARESVDPAALERWVGHPLDVLGRALPGAEAASAIAALRRRLTSELRDRTVAVADLHGSVPPERWSFNTDGTEVVAVEHALPVGRGLPEVDLILVVLARRRLLAVGGGRERGADPMLDLLSDGWSADERAAVGSSWSINDDVRPTTLVLLAWLHWVVEQLIEEVGARSRRPVTSEAQRVLARIAEEEKAGAIAPAPAPARPS
ncbi:MAG: hypothetical protein JWN46_1681, partial [Acidimicrobiales bacterium]|nr:hypothetical protein [Acidimicrobiales bacterium]